VEEHRVVSSTDSVDASHGVAISGMVSSELINWLQECVDADSVNKASDGDAYRVTLGEAMFAMCFRKCGSLCVGVSWVFIDCGAGLDSG